MRRAACAVLISSALMPMAHAANATDGGGPCSKLGVVKTVTQKGQAVSVTCTLVGNKKLWRTGAPATSGKDVGRSTISCSTGKSLPELASAKYPKRGDRIDTYQLGPVRITATPVVTVTDMEKGTNLYFTFSNSSSSPVAVRLANWSSVAASRPNWLLHFWPVIDVEVSADGSFEVAVAANGSTTLKIYMSNDSPPGISTTTYRYRFELGSATVEIPMAVTWTNGEFGDSGQRVPESARLMGRVVDASGAPIAGATVAAFLGNGLWKRGGTTDAKGAFTIPLVSDEGMAALTGGRTTKPKAQWHLTVDKPGYRLATDPSLRLEHGKIRNCTVRLSGLTQSTYSLTGDVHFDDPYGFWDMETFGAGDRIVATPGWHPTEAVNVSPLPRPGHIVAVDFSGKVLWRVPVGDWCWRIAVHPAGAPIATNCADGYLRIIDANGVVLKQMQINLPTAYNSSAGLAFSPDGTKLFVSAGHPMGPRVLDTRSWETLWTVPGEIMMAQWSNTDAELVTASLTGVINSFTSSGALRWRRGIGGVPLYMNVDAQGRVTVSGKSHTAYSWDANGTPLWNYEMSNTTNRTRYGRGASADGNYLFFAGQQGLVQALNSSGQLLWERLLPESLERAPSGNMQLRLHNPGHGATYVTPDGSYVVLGARMNQVLVIARDGSLLWSSEQYPARRADFDETRAYHPNANAVTATPDGRTIVAGYSDGTIRIFTKKG